MLYAYAIEVNAQGPCTRRLIVVASDVASAVEAAGAAYEDRSMTSLSYDQIVAVTRGDVIHAVEGLG